MACAPSGWTLKRGKLGEKEKNWADDVGLVSCSDPRVVPELLFPGFGGIVFLLLLLHLSPYPFPSLSLSQKPFLTPPSLISAAIIRNAGGRTQDTIRSILALDAVANVGTVVVIHHNGLSTPLSFLVPLPPQKGRN